MMRSFAMTVCAAALALSLQARVVAAETSGNITVLTIVDVTPDYALADNVRKSAALLADLAAATQNSPGVVSFKILRDARRDNHFVIEGIWTDMKSFDLYSGAAATRAFRAAFQPGAAGPFDERIYVDLK
jgi:quinol monooxygenase YgiN